VVHNRVSCKDFFQEKLKEHKQVPFHPQPPIHSLLHGANLLKLSSLTTSLLWKSNPYADTQHKVLGLPLDDFHHFRAQSTSSNHQMSLPMSLSQCTKQTDRKYLHPVYDRSAAFRWGRHCLSPSIYKQLRGKKRRPSDRTLIPVNQRLSSTTYVTLCFRGSPPTLPYWTGSTYLVFPLVLCTYGSRVAQSVGLDDRAIEVDPRQKQEDFFSSLCVWTSSGAHPASCPTGTGVPFPGGKARPRRDAGHSPPPSAEVLNK
jgi:hypothetical protein